jgi:SMC interacting uncharacterized protein involved in chromosome segregation
MDQKVEELRKLLEQKKMDVLETVEDVEQALRDRKEDLENQITVIKDDLGETVDDVKLWLDSNGKTVLVAGVLFMIGLAVGFISGNFYVV